MRFRPEFMIDHWGVSIEATMSALGQKQTYAVQNAMSALPPIATEKADICRIKRSARSAPKIGLSRTACPVARSKIEPVSAPRLCKTGIFKKLTGDFPQELRIPTRGLARQRLADKQKAPHTRPLAAVV